MSLNTFITKELLFAYFAGQVTALQKQRIQEWVADPANEEFFYACVHEWETSNPQYAADVDRGIEKFYQQIAQLPGQGAPSLPASPGLDTRQKGGSWPGWLVAASVVLLIGLSSFLLGDLVWYKRIQTGYGQIKQVALPDGSQVMLNANSELAVPRFGFGFFSRQVALSGEASFEVVHTPDHKRFVVLAKDGFQVEVLGTAFNVFARERGVQVGLIRGKVKVLYGQAAQQPKSFTLSPGDLVTLEKGRQTLQLRKVLHPENFAAWQQGRFIFENTPLTEIKAILLENYGLSLELKGKGLARQTVSGSFKAASVEELLQALAETMDLQVIHQDKQVVLTSP